MGSDNNGKHANSSTFETRLHEKQDIRNVSTRIRRALLQDRNPDNKIRIKQNIEEGKNFLSYHAGGTEVEMLANFAGSFDRAVEVVGEIRREHPDNFEKAFILAEAAQRLRDDLILERIDFNIRTSEKSV